MRVVGVDVGTQSLKVVVGDDQLRILGEHRVAYDVERPAADRAEQAPAIWERALGPAIAGALAAADTRATDIAALALTGQLDGCVAVDAAGDPLGAALIWQDRRAIDDTHGNLAALEAGDAPARIFALTGQVADPSHLAPKARWLARHGVRAARFHQPVSYLVERLTGIAVIDPALASTTMLFELAAARWSAELLAAFEVAEAQLPRVAPAASIAGPLDARGAALTGLPRGTPVAVGTGDDFAMALGAGLSATASPTIMCAIGTAEVVGTVTPTLVLDRITSEPMVETHAFPGGGFVIENPGWLAGGAVRWACDLLGLASAADLDALAAAAPTGADGVVFVPALAGAMTPTWRPHARGTFHGLTAAHDRRHLARAVLEGVACACRDVVDRLAALGLPTADVLLLGGGAASSVWPQLRADVLGRTHRVAAYADTAALGAALLAIVAATDAELAAAAATLAPRTITIAPDPAVAAAADRTYRRYQALVAQLAPLALAPW